MSISLLLEKHQAEALTRIQNGSVINGGVGSGKTLTSLAYYYRECGGDLNTIEDKTLYREADKLIPLIIITTAAARDAGGWIKDLYLIGLDMDKCDIVVDSWNNIGKYVDRKDSFFIFDEQKVTGYGVWSKHMIKITKSNKWLFLSATPGDSFIEYLTLFIAHGFVKNKRDFTDNYVVFRPFTKYPQIQRYRNMETLMYFRSKILVKMDYEKKHVREYIDLYFDCDKETYNHIATNRVKLDTGEPLDTVSSLYYELRKNMYTHAGRLDVVKEIWERHKRCIIFYNFTYEVDMIKAYAEKHNIPLFMRNGQQHDPLPTSDSWLYVVQYAAGAEGWNCITTDCVIFFSQTYSYKQYEQASGRIDRINTPYSVLKYYNLISRCSLDTQIKQKLKHKKNFNESANAKRNSAL